MRQSFIRLGKPYSENFSIIRLNKKKGYVFFPVNPKQQISSHVLKNISKFTRDIADIFNIFDDIHVFGSHLKM